MFLCKPQLLHKHARCLISTKTFNTAFPKNYTSPPIPNKRPLQKISTSPLDKEKEKEKEREKELEKETSTFTSVSADINSLHGISFSTSQEFAQFRNDGDSGDKKLFDSKKSPEDIMKKITSRIQATVAPLPDNAEPQVLFCLGVPGITVNTSLTPDDVALLVDNIPHISQFWLPSNRRVRDEYAAISVAQADSPPADPKLREAAERGRAYINTVVGDKTIFDLYMQYKTAWQQVKQKFDEETIKPKSERNQNEVNKLTDELDNKTVEWQNKGYMNEVDDALTAMLQYLSGDPKAAFAEAAKRIKMLTKKTPGGAPYLPVDCIPENWVEQALATETTGGLSWTEVELKESESEDKLHTAVSSLSTQSGLSAGGGLWKVGVNVGVSKDTKDVNSKSTVSNFALKMKIARVEIERPWFNGSLFSLAAYIPGRQKHSICGPSLIPNRDGVQPTFNILPVALVVARDLIVYNDFSQEEQSFHDEKTKVDVDASISYGPFKLNNKTSSMKATTDEEKKKYGASGALAFTNPQIIGFLCTLNTPAFPAKDSLQN